MSAKIIDRYRGALLGLATGDAVGTTLEFTQPGNFAPITDMLGGGPFNLEPGQWTDDTSMALCLADSLTYVKDFDLVDQLKRYARWYRFGYFSSTGECFDIGNTTRAALRKFERSEQPYCGSTNPRSAGNGSIMRLAPVPLFYGKNPAKAIEQSGESSRTTHGAQAAVDGCRYLAALMVGALNGVDKKELLSARYSPIPGYWDEFPLMPEIDEVAAGSFKVRMPPDFDKLEALKESLDEAALVEFYHSEPPIQGSGYVVKSLEAALWAFYHSDSFKEGCLLAVNLGDDADTTGAVYGQLAGAFYGVQNIPAAWQDKLKYRHLIESLADKLYNLAGFNEAA